LPLLRDDAGIIGSNYVPIARLAAAQAALGKSARDKNKKPDRVSTFRPLGVTDILVILFAQSHRLRRADTRSA
jgi:hypothetical protein